MSEHEAMPAYRHFRLADKTSDQEIAPTWSAFKAGYEAAKVPDQPDGCPCCGYHVHAGNDDGSAKCFSCACMWFPSLRNPVREYSTPLTGHEAREAKRVIAIGIRACAACVDGSNDVWEINPETGANRIYSMLMVSGFHVGKNGSNPTDIEGGKP